MFDYEKLSPEYIWATGAVIFALCVGYWLIDE
ncbi:MAG: phosphate-starvation-inducible PsiE family protein [Desulfonatronovibrio sp.]